MLCFVNPNELSYHNIENILPMDTFLKHNVSDVQINDALNKAGAHDIFTVSFNGCVIIDNKTQNYFNKKEIIDMLKYNNINSIDVYKVLEAYLI